MMGERHQPAHRILNQHEARSDGTGAAYGYMCPCVTAGTLGVVLTLGSLGAAIITLGPAPEDAAAAAGSSSSSSRSTGLEPVDACSSCSSSCGNSSGSSGSSYDAVSARPCSGSEPHMTPAAAAAAAAAGTRYCRCRLRGANTSHVHPGPPPSFLNRSLTSAAVAGAGPAAAAATASPPPPAARAPYRLDVVHLRALPAEVVSCNGAGGGAGGNVDGGRGVCVCV